MSNNNNNNNVVLQQQEAAANISLSPKRVLTVAIEVFTMLTIVVLVTTVLIPKIVDLGLAYAALSSLSVFEKIALLLLTGIFGAVSYNIKRIGP